MAWLKIILKLSLNDEFITKMIMIQKMIKTKFSLHHTSRLIVTKTYSNRFKFEYNMYRQRLTI